MIFANQDLKDRSILILGDSGVSPSFYIRLIDPLSRITNNYNILTSSEAETGILSPAVHLVIVHRWFNGIGAIILDRLCTTGAKLGRQH